MSKKSRPLTVTSEQKQALDAIISYIKNPTEHAITLGGYAGTGKTTLLAILRKILKKHAPKLKIGFCSYTGKATRVLENSLRAQGDYHEQDSVSTIHSLIYSPVVKKGVVSQWRLKSKLSCDLIIVDEASMVDEQIWDDLTSFGVPIVAVGDHGQLPPISGDFNLMNNPDIVLETIHRQARTNPIIALSLQARQTGQISIGDYGQGVMKLSRKDPLSGEIVEEKLRQHSNNILILTGYNHSRVKINKAIRQFRDFPTHEPHVGDVVICLKNNWEKHIYNGMQGTIQHLEPVRKGGNHLWYDAEIVMDDGAHLYTGMINAMQFGHATTLSKHPKLASHEIGDLFDFGYALTVHKAQGSQQEEVILFEERNKHMSDDDWRRWLYTGVTRAQERLVVVGD